MLLLYFRENSSTEYVILMWTENLCDNSGVVMETVMWSPCDKFVAILCCDLVNVIKITIATNALWSCDDIFTQKHPHYGMSGTFRERSDWTEVHKFYAVTLTVLSNRLPVEGIEIKCRNQHSISRTLLSRQG